MMYSNVGYGTIIFGTVVMAAPREALWDDLAVV